MTPETAAQLATDWARSGGYTLTPEGMAIVAERIASTLERDASGFAYRDEAFGETFRIENGATVPVPVGEFVASLMQRHGKLTPEAPEPAAPAAPAKPTPAVSSVPEWARGRTGIIAELTQDWAAKHDAEMVALTETYKNPWLTGQINRTYQVHISKHNPALAAKYKAQAGV